MKTLLLANSDGFDMIAWMVVLALLGGAVWLLIQWITLPGRLYRYLDDFTRRLAVLEQIHRAQLDEQKRAADNLATACHLLAQLRPAAPEPWQQTPDP